MLPSVLYWNLIAILTILQLWVIVQTANGEVQSASPNMCKIGCGSEQGDKDAKLNVPQLIRKYGYPVEVHHVTTDDGYILTIHRIPYGKDHGSREKKRVILLQHGLMLDSSIWILNSENKALGFKLANAGFDVWMGNHRGNDYSKRHVRLSTRNPEYWNFSWQEMGKYDIPAFIDYILGYTGQEKLYYTGHSMGTTVFFVAMSERPEYNSKIHLMSAFAPLAYTKHMISPLRIFHVISNQIEDGFQLSGAYEFAPSSLAVAILGTKLCRASSPIHSLCTNVYFISTGYDSAQFNVTLIPTIMGHVPSGTSTRAVAHYAQGVTSGRFQKFDYGTPYNLEVYGRLTPPSYNVSRITAPVAFYWGQNDWLATPADVAVLATQMPNVVRNYRVRYDKFNHVDFVLAINADELLNIPYMEFMKRFY